MSTSHSPLLPAAIGIVYDSPAQKRVLWVKRKDFPVWVLPGGGVESGESPESAVLREIEEESGIKASIAYKGALFHPTSHWTAETHLFVCIAESGSLGETEEAYCAEFFPLNAFPSPLLPTHRLWFEKIKKQKGTLLEEEVPGANAFFLIPFLLKHPIISIRFLLSRWK